MTLEITFTQPAQFRDQEWVLISLVHIDQLASSKMLVIFFLLFAMYKLFLCIYLQVTLYRIAFVVDL